MITLNQCLLVVFALRELSYDHFLIKKTKIVFKTKKRKNKTTVLLHNSVVVMASKLHGRVSMMVCIKGFKANRVEICCTVVIN